jgi:hypothetical protein
MFVAIEFFSEDPTRNTAAGFDLHPPLGDSVLDNVDFATALAKARCETAVAFFRYRFFPLREPCSLRPEDDVSAGVVGLDTVTEGNVSDLER